MKEEIESAKKNREKQFIKDMSAERFLKDIGVNPFTPIYVIYSNKSTPISKIIEQYHKSQQSEKEKELYEALFDLIEGELTTPEAYFETWDKAKQTLEKYKPNN